MNSYPQLVSLGSGILQIDALSAKCTFQGEPTAELGIARSLHSWLGEDLATNHIDAKQLKRAELVAAIELSTIDSKSRVTRDFHMDKDEKPIEKGAFHRLTIRCTSEVETDEKTYRSTYSDVEEFPHGWPAI